MYRRGVARVLELRVRRCVAAEQEQCGERQGQIPHRGKIPKGEPGDYGRWHKWPQNFQVGVPQFSGGIVRVEGVATARAGAMGPGPGGPRDLEPPWHGSCSAPGWHDPCSAPRPLDKRPWHASCWRVRMLALAHLCQPLDTCRPSSTGSAMWPLVNPLTARCHGARRARPVLDLCSGARGDVAWWSRGAPRDHALLQPCYIIWLTPRAAPARLCRGREPRPTTTTTETP